MKDKQRTILGVRVHPGTYETVIQHVGTWINRKEKTYICVATVYLVTECQKDPALLTGVNSAGLVVTDGMPLVWLVRRHQDKKAQRVYGPTLMLKLCVLAAERRWRIFLLGGEKGQSARLARQLRERFPGLLIVGSLDTPIRPIPARDAAMVTRTINESKAQIVFVGMGCPYQEQWMIHERKKLDANILIGVGAAFDFFTGRQKQAPVWVQNIGFEWLFRLVQEPKRLWRRYVFANTKFCIRIFDNFMSNLWNR